MEVVTTIYQIRNVENKKLKILMPEMILFGEKENDRIKVQDYDFIHLSETNYEEGDVCYYDSIPVDEIKKSLKEISSESECSEEQITKSLVDLVESRVVFIENSKTKELKKEDFEEEYGIDIDYDNKTIKEKNKTSNEKIKEGLTIDEILKNIETKIMFQNNAIKRVVSTIINNQYLENTKNIVLIGSKGVGKSKLIDLLARELSSPYAKIEGYSGEELANAYLTLFLSSKDNNRIGPPIVFIDGINKGLDKLNRIDGDILVELISNMVKTKTKFPIQLNKQDTVLFDPSDINYIIALDLEKDIDSPNVVGIGKNDVEMKRKIISKLRELLVDANCEIIDMNDLSEKNLKTILEFSQISPINEYRKILESQDTKLKVSKRAYELLAKEAYKLEKGAKGLSIITDYVVRDDIIDAQLNGKETIYINEKKVLKKINVPNIKNNLY